MKMTGTFERVYTVTDHWDGPREGVADYAGVPHVYRSVWRRETDDWDVDRYYLCPIAASDAELALEAWAIWLRFTEHYRGKVAPVPSDPADWGALPEDLIRRRELRQRLAPVLALDVNRCIIARAEFRSVDTHRERGFIVPRLEARWTLTESKPDDELLAPRAV